MSRKLKVAIDLDSTLSGRSFLQETLNVYNNLYNDNVKYDDIKEWDLSKSLKKATMQQIYDIWTPELISSLQPDPYARELIETLISQGHEVIVVTSYSAHHCVAKVEWCKKHLELDENNIIFCRKKYMIDCDVLIDDYLKNFVDEYDMPIKAEKIVYTQPYNLNVFGLGWYYRVGDLSEVHNIIDVICKK